MADKKKPAPNVKTKPGDQRGSRPGQHGQPPYVATERDREYVRRHVFYMGHERVARKLGISRQTLERHYRTEIDEAQDEFLLAGSMTAAKQALKGDGQMLRFVLSRRFPELYSEKKSLEHSGNIGTTKVDLTEFLKDKTKDECRALLGALDLLAAAGGVDFERDDSGLEEADT